VTEEREDDLDLLRDIAENLLGNAERCYRLARGTADFKVREGCWSLLADLRQRRKTPESGRGADQVPI